MYLTTVIGLKCKFHKPVLQNPEVALQLLHDHPLMLPLVLYAFHQFYVPKKSI